MSLLKRHSAKRFWLAGLVLLIASGCGSSGGNRLVGTWRMDMAALSSGFANNMGNSVGLTLVFQPSTWSYAHDTNGDVSSSASGNWKFLRAEGDAIVISMTLGDIPTGERTITFTDQNTMQMSMGSSDVPQTYKRVSQ